MKNNSLEKEVNRHLKEVKSNLLISKSRKKFIKTFKDSVYEYIETNPLADIKSIKENFGTPDEIAASFAANINYQEINKHTRIKYLIVSGILIMLLIVVAYLSAALIDVHRSANGFGVITISENITEEDTI